MATPHGAAWGTTHPRERPTGSYPLESLDGPPVSHRRRGPADRVGCEEGQAGLGEAEDRVDGAGKEDHRWPICENLSRDLLVHVISANAPPTRIPLLSPPPHVPSPLSFSCPPLVHDRTQKSPFHHLGLPFLPLSGRRQIS